MSEKKADRPRYWLVYLPKDLKEGQTFKPDLLHLTLITWFVTEKEENLVIKSFRNQFSGERSFNLTLGQLTEFKSQRRISINPVHLSSELLALHEKSLEWFSSLEARWAVKNPHIGPEYIPHIRRRKGHNLSEGDQLGISSLSLVSARRNGDDSRTVAAKVDFL